jgi:hypothetical protein
VTHRLILERHTGNKYQQKHQLSPPKKTEYPETAAKNFDADKFFGDMPDCDDRLTRTQ